MQPGSSQSSSDADDQLSDELDPTLVGEFVSESLQGLQEIEADLLTLETAGNDSELINRIFRTVHTIKGSGGYLKLARWCPLRIALKRCWIMCDSGLNNPLPTCAMQSSGRSTRSSRCWPWRTWERRWIFKARSTSWMPRWELLPNRLGIHPQARHPRRRSMTQQLSI